jgi:ABC-2 type transport system permease protein
MATTNVTATAAPGTVYHPSFWRTLWTNAVMAPRTSLGFMRVDFVLGTVFIIPLTQMVFFAFVVQLGGGGASAIEFTAVGNAVATVTYSSVFSVCQTTDSEKQQGTMEHLLVSPANRLALYFGRGLIPILVSLATVAVGLTYAALLFGVSIPTSVMPGLAVSIVLTAFAMVGFGLLLGGVALYLRTSIILGNIFLFVGLLLSGVNFPLSSLPLPLQYAGDALPLTWGLAAIRASLAGDSFGTLAGLWGAVALAAALSFGAAIALWKYFEHRALATGSIARF